MGAKIKKKKEKPHFYFKNVNLLLPYSFSLHLSLGEKKHCN